MPHSAETPARCKDCCTAGCTFKLLVPPSVSRVLQVDLGADATLELQGSLLQLRGTLPGVSPIKDKHGNLLVLNGRSHGLALALGSSQQQSLCLKSGNYQTSTVQSTAAVKAASTTEQPGA